MPDLKNTIKDHPLTYFREIPDLKSTIKDHRLAHFREMSDVVGKEPTKSGSDWTGGKRIDNNRRMRSEDASLECLPIDELEKDVDALCKGKKGMSSKILRVTRPWELSEANRLYFELYRRKALLGPKLYSLAYFEELEKLYYLMSKVRVLLEELH